MQLLDGVCISRKQQQFRRIELARVKLLQDCRDFETDADGSNRAAVDNLHTNTTATLSRVQARNRNERLVDKANTRQVAVVEFRGDIVAIHPRSAELLKWRFSPPTDGNAGILQNLETGIENCALLREQIR